MQPSGWESEAREPIGPAHEPVEAIHVLVLDTTRPLELEDCVSCLTIEQAPEIRVDVVDWEQMERTLRGMAASARRIAIVAMDGGSRRNGELLGHIRFRWPQLPVLVVAKSAQPGDVCRWLDAGVADYVTPPLTPASLLPRILHKASTGRRPEGDALTIQGLIGRSRAFVSVVEQIHAVARCDGPVLIEGETGTGKEVCARAIHQLSSRRARSFSPINCGAIPKDLVENELFGHHKAAFTGASGLQLGIIAASEGGTLLFDEIDSFGPGPQATLLRFVQNQEYRPLGSTRVIKADVRVLAATNTNLAEKVARGEFREDLYYRLDMLRLHVPPLRERREDIPLLATHALATFAERFRARGRAFSDVAMEALIAHDWTGNDRQLEHVIGRSVAFAFHEEVIRREHLDIPTGGDGAQVLSVSLRESKRRLIEDFERSKICAYLAAHEGNIARAAQAAGKNRRAFWELMRKYSIRGTEFRVPCRHARGPLEGESRP